MVMFLVLCFLVVSFSVISAQNDYPIVLVHGFFGWGREEVFNFRYWGMLQGDFQEKLRAQGYEVYTAAVGPFSSNWDRACELFAQIKGGTVDYGEKHSRTHRHNRYGRTYKGFYPEWGTIQNGRRKKIHLIGHSMGGQTIRLLAHLLSHGLDDNIDELLAKGSNYSTLHETGHDDWIHSITTVSTPNEGTTLADKIYHFKELATKGLAAISYVMNTFGLADKVLDLKLDQWNVSTRRKDESIYSYFTRSSAIKIFDENNHDTAAYDLSTTGAREFNLRVQDSPHIYYYSIQNFDTYRTSIRHEGRDVTIHQPYLFSMNIAFQPFSRIIGGIYTLFTLNKPQHWVENDGVVNTYSMLCPENSTMVDYNGTSVAGRWHFIRKVRLDHAAIVGLVIFAEVYELYESHARMLLNLQPDPHVRRLEENPSYYRSLPHKAPRHIVRNMHRNFDKINYQVENFHAQSIDEKQAMIHEICDKLFKQKSIKNSNDFLSHIRRMSCSHFIYRFQQ